MHEVMRPHAPSVVQMCINLARTDNEENVVLCFKILLDCFRSFRGLLEHSLQPYLAVLIDMFRQVPLTVDEVFGEGAIPPDADPLADAGEAQEGRRPAGQADEVPPGMKSLKVLHEAAVHIVHLVQTWRSESVNIIHTFAPVGVAVRFSP